MPTPQENAFNAISEERIYQNRKWGTIKDRPHTIAEWILIAEAELEEAKRAWTKECSDLRALSELLQTAAVIVAALEQHSAYACQSSLCHEAPADAHDKDRHYSLHCGKS